MLCLSEWRSAAYEDTLTDDSPLALPFESSYKILARLERLARKQLHDVHKGSFGYRR